MTKLIIILDVNEDPDLTDPHEIAEDILSIVDDEHRAGNTHLDPELIAAEWEGTAGLTAVLHLEEIR